MNYYFFRISLKLPWIIIFFRISLKLPWIIIFSEYHWNFHELFFFQNITEAAKTISILFGILLKRPWNIFFPENHWNCHDFFFRISPYAMNLFLRNYHWNIFFFLEYHRDNIYLFYSEIFMVVTIFTTKNKNSLKPSMYFSLIRNNVRKCLNTTKR